jgi:hypothetical protein
MIVCTFISDRLLSPAGRKAARAALRDGSSNAIRDAFSELLPAFKQETGHHGGVGLL